MSKTLHDQLIELASEFATLRQSGKRNWFPDAVWKKAVSIAKQLPVMEVCKAIDVHPAYFRKKMALFSSLSQEPPITFLELIPTKPNSITMHIESSQGHKLSVDGIAISDFTSVLSAFLKGGSPCCK